MAYLLEPKLQRFLCCSVLLLGLVFLPAMAWAEPPSDTPSKSETGLSPQEMQNWQILEKMLEDLEKEVEKSTQDWQRQLAMLKELKTEAEKWRSLSEGYVKRIESLESSIRSADEAFQKEIVRAQFEASMWRGVGLAGAGAATGALIAHIPGALIGAGAGAVSGLLLHLFAAVH